MYLKGPEANIVDTVYLHNELHNPFYPNISNVYVNIVLVRHSKILSVYTICQRHQLKIANEVTMTAFKHFYSKYLIINVINVKF